MNQFRTIRQFVAETTFWFFLIFLNLFLASPAFSQSAPQPTLNADKPLFSDYDSTNQIVYVFLEKELWTYSLKDEAWNLEAQIKELPEPLADLEFGFNPRTQEPQFWSRGVGSVYGIDTASGSLTRQDLSFKHKNQYGHIPFFRKGRLYAFGGYGLWTFKNFISQYNPEVREWSLHAPNKLSDFPFPREARFGFYHQQDDALYIYGGTYSKNNRPDDKYVEKLTTNELWKYSFPKDQWEYVTSFAFENWRAYTPTSLPKVGRINSMSSSTFSPHSQLWYMPFRNEKSTDMIFHLVPFNIETEEVYEPVEIHLPSKPGFFISSYFYDSQTASFVFLGMDHLTNRKEYPLRIITLPEDSLLQVIQAKPFSLPNLGLLLSFGGIIVICLLIWYRYNVLQQDTSADSDSKQHGSRSIMAGLNEQEQTLLHILKEKAAFTESHELEESAWPNIKNYDYRRKLRNETINSINEKCEHLFEGAQLIIRKKDPNDNRRYLYGLNPEIYEL